MKYEFKKNTIDDYTLIYTNKDGKEVKKDFKRTVEMAENLQGITTMNKNIIKVCSIAFAASFLASCSDSFRDFS